MEKETGGVYVPVIWIGCGPEVEELFSIGRRKEVKREWGGRGKARNNIRH